MALRPRHAAVAAPLALAACFGGKDPLNPGTPLGTFHVEGKLADDSCGPSSGAPADWPFDVKLSRDGSTLYWVQGQAPVSGQLDAQSHTTMKSTDTRTVHDANPRAGVGACTMTRDDALDMTLAPDEASFTGTLSYTFSATDGSDCADQLISGGGTFATLPCTTKYALTATRTALPTSAR
jgi:hypothetical protein